MTKGSKPEYRVVWQREGRNRQTRIFQSWDAAIRKFQAIVATDEAKRGTRLDTLPPLVGTPVMEVRRCDPWEDNPHQPEAIVHPHVVENLHWQFGGPLDASLASDEVPF